MENIADVRFVHSHTERTGGDDPRDGPGHELVLNPRPVSGLPASVIMLGRYGYWPVRFQLDPKPPDPPYSELIARHRGGDVEPLQVFVLKSIAGIV